METWLGIRAQDQTGAERKKSNQMTIEEFCAKSGDERMEIVRHIWPSVIGLHTVMKRMHSKHFPIDTMSCHKCVMAILNNLEW